MAQIVLCSLANSSNRSSSQFKLKRKHPGANKIHKSIPGRPVSKSTSGAIWFANNVKISSRTCCRRVNILKPGEALRHGVTRTTVEGDALDGGRAKFQWGVKSASHSRFFFSVKCVGNNAKTSSILSFLYFKCENFMH